MSQLWSKKRTFFTFLLFILGIFTTISCSGSNGQPTNLLKISHVLQEQLIEWKGVPYVYGGQSKKGIDCSGFVQLTFKNKLNIVLPRSTVEQAKMGSKISKKNLRSGDLVLFKTGKNSHHVGIYDTNGTFVHASTSKGVIRSSLNNPYWKNHFWQARRL